MTAVLITVLALACGVVGFALGWAQAYHRGYEDGKRHARRGRVGKIHPASVPPPYDWHGKEVS